MTAAQKLLLEEVLALPEDARQRIGEALIDSLSGSEEATEQAWRAEALRRAEEVDRGDAKLQDIDTVLRQLRTQLA